ncbi:MAG: ExeA family protein [Thermodesulfobacteriota bacterium]
MSSSGWAEKFGFSRNPFKDTLNTDLFYRTRQHEEALVKLRIGIEDCHALILLSGVSGTGKTLLSQLVMRELGERFATVIVPVYPEMGKGTLLDRILAEAVPERRQAAKNADQLLRQVQETALALYQSGRRLVIVIDEAHFLKADALHILRTLSNLETEQEKLVTVLLIAEKGLSRRLAHPSYASLRSRITFAVQLEPLRQRETEQFIKFRLLKCGASPSLLTSDAYTEAHRLSNGIPREINRLLYNGFLEAMSGNQPVLTGALMATAGRKAGLYHVQHASIATQSVPP